MPLKQTAGQDGEAILDGTSNLERFAFASEATGSITERVIPAPLVEIAMGAGGGWDEERDQATVALQPPTFSKSVLSALDAVEARAGAPQSDDATALFAPASIPDAEPDDGLGPALPNTPSSPGDGSVETSIHENVDEVVAADSYEVTPSHEFVDQGELRAAEARGGECFEGEDSAAGTEVRTKRSRSPLIAPRASPRVLPRFRPTAKSVPPSRR
jgi:hypothetical protein